MRLHVHRKEFLRLLAATPAAALVGGAWGVQKTRAESTTEPFADRVLRDNAAAMLSMGAYIGDRLGIFRAMSTTGPASLRELARNTGLNKRYLQEWLGLMVTGRYVQYDAASARYTLPAEHSRVLSDDNSRDFMGGFLELLAAVFVTPKVIEGFRNGKGPVSGDYQPDFWEGIERSTAPTYQHLLTQLYLTTVPDVIQRLVHGELIRSCGDWRLVQPSTVLPPSVRIEIHC
jgi:hypothetical protein